MAVEHTEDEDKGMMTFATGAHRSNATAGKRPIRYDLIPREALERVARTYGEGAIKYGDSNWKSGFPASDLANRVMNHMMLWLSNDQTVDEKTGEVEDHLAHAAWNLFAIMYNEKQLPHMIDIRERPEFEQHLKHLQESKDGSETSTPDKEDSGH
jgi:hypothetical protein